FLVHSFAGDDPIICRDHVRKLVGLPEFKPNGRRRRSSDEIGQVLRAAIRSQRQKPQGYRVATYKYKDTDGVVLYEVLKFANSKTFRQRRPNGNNWIWNLEGVTRVLYRLPDLIKYSFGTVFICEGEKDADRVAEYDLCSTAVASGKWDGVDVSV